MPRGERQSVRRQAKRDFFIQIPAFLDYLPDLDTYSWRLYIHYLRVCGEDDHCYEYTSTTSILTGMSERTIRYRRETLKKLKLIDYWYEGQIGQERVYIEIRDVWEVNAVFLRLLQGNQRGEWIIDWIRKALGLPSTGENTLRVGKSTHAPDADPAAPDADPNAPDADPAAPDADKERSLYTDPSYTDPVAAAALSPSLVKEIGLVGNSQCRDHAHEATRIAAGRFAADTFPHGGFNGLANYIADLPPSRLETFCAVCYYANIKEERGDTDIDDFAAFVRGMTDKEQYPGFTPAEQQQFDNRMTAHLRNVESDVWEDSQESEYTP